MRNQDSLFDHFCTFIKVKGEGTSYETKELISDVGIHEQPTQWKRWSRNKHYTTRGYQSLLRKGGFIENTKRGHWLILREVPEWFTLPHLYTLVGYTYNHVGYPIDGGKYEWRQVPRTDMSKQEILDKLNGITPKLRQAADNFNTAAFHDPLYYASGAFAKEVDKTTQPKIETRNLGGEIFTPQPVTVEKVQPSDSTFYQQPEQWKYGQQLQENLMMNSGYVNSALAILDQADFIDPVMHARVINIMAQLSDLQRTIDERVEYKRNKQNI